MQSVRFYKRSDNSRSLSINKTDNTARVPPGRFDPFSNHLIIYNSAKLRRAGAEPCAGVL